MSDNISLWNYVDVSSRLRNMKYTDNQIEPKDFEALFIYQLQNRLYQVAMGKKWDKPQTRAETRSPRFPDSIVHKLFEIAVVALVRVFTIRIIYTFAKST